VGLTAKKSSPQPKCERRSAKIDGGTAGSVNGKQRQSRRLDIQMSCVTKSPTLEYALSEEAKRETSLFCDGQLSLGVLRRAGRGVLRVEYEVVVGLDG